MTTTTTIPVVYSKQEAHAPCNSRPRSTINASAATVFALYADVANWPSSGPRREIGQPSRRFCLGRCGREAVPHGGPKSAVHFVAVVNNQSVHSECKLPLEHAV